MKPTSFVPFVLLSACVPGFGTNADFKLLGVASSTVADCQFGEGAPPLVRDAIVLDLANSHTLRLPLVVQNEGGGVLSPNLFDARWECATDALSAGRGPLFVPAFSTTSPFCLDSMDLSNNFVGADLLPVTGAPIQSGQTSVVWVEVVTPTLGQGISDVIDAGVLAGKCKPEFNGGFDAPADCEAFGTTFQALFSRPPEPHDLDQLERFAELDGNFAATQQSSPPRLSSGYSMVLRGVLGSPEGDGFTQSNEVIQIVEICRNCGELRQSDPPTRALREGYDCYHASDIPR